jgi:ACS family tartrate transporter-like MFS transporter
VNNTAVEVSIERTRLRVMLRILPYLFLLYIICFLDRVNVGYAALEMTKDLSFTPEIYGFGAGIFFFGYFLLEVPGCLIVEKWGARRWIARIMVSWGLLAVLMGFIHTAPQFYVLRFLLGLAEAGFFPGIVVYLSYWFRYEDRAKATALFMAAIPIANIVGAPISGVLLGVNWLQFAGWRWLFILEGLPAVILGVVTLFYLIDYPHQAKWLSDDEREWITSELEKERRIKREARDYSVMQAFKDRKVVMLTVAYSLMLTSSYGFTLWLPSVIKQVSGSSNLIVSLLTTLPACVGLISMLVFGWSSDHNNERHCHAAVPMMVAGIGLLLAAVTQNHAAIAIAMLCLAQAGINGFLPVFWSLPSSFLTGAAAAATVGMINSIGNLGGFLGPYAVGYVTEATGSFAGAFVLLSIMAIMGGVMILMLRYSQPKVVTAVEMVR